MCRRNINKINTVHATDWHYHECRFRVDGEAVWAVFLFNDFPLNSSTSIIFYSLRLLIFLPAIYVNILVLLMSKREDLLIASELRMISMI